MRGSRFAVWILLSVIAVAAAPPGISIAAQAEEEAEDVEHRMAKKGGKRLQARKPKRKV